MRRGVLESSDGDREKDAFALRGEADAILGIAAGLIALGADCWAKADFVEAERLAGEIAVLGFATSCFGVRQAIAHVRSYGDDP